MLVFNNKGMYINPFLYYEGKSLAPTGPLEAFWVLQELNSCDLNINRCGLKRGLLFGKASM